MTWRALAVGLVTGSTLAIGPGATVPFFLLVLVPLALRDLVRMAAASTAAVAV